MGPGKRFVRPYNRQPGSEQATFYPQHSIRGAQTVGLCHGCGATFKQHAQRLTEATSIFYYVVTYNVRSCNELPCSSVNELPCVEYG